MKRLLFVVLAVISIAATANAASLSVAADKLTYAVGETITLAVTGDDGGTNAYGIFGRLDYSGALVDNGTRAQTQIVHADGAWAKGVLNASDNGTTAFSYAFNQVSGPFATDALNLPGSLSTVTLIAKAVGFINVAWHTTGDSTTLDFFGLTNAPGTSFSIVPEPATVALLPLGLLALATARHTRRRP